MALRLALLKYADAIVGRAISLVLPSRKPGPEPVNDLRRILVIRPGGIGDAALLVPALISLREHYPHASVHILAEKRNSAVFELTEGIERVYCYDRGRELLQVVRNSYDLVIDTEQWHRLSAIIARLTRAPLAIGFDTNDRRKHFTHPVPYSHDWYEIDSFLRLLHPLLGPVIWDRKVPFLTVPQRIRSRTSEVLEPLAPGSAVALFPGSSIRERQWGASKFRDTARLLSDRGYAIVVVGGEQDRETGEAVTDGVPRSLNLCGRLSLPETAAVLSSCSLLITGDSGILHVGYGLGMRLIALFGPGREEKWAPHGPDVAVINRHLPCGPCTTFGYTPRCSKNARCLKEITPEEVVEASLRLFEPRG